MAQKYTATIHRHRGYRAAAQIRIKLKFFVYRAHQGKERAYINALRRAGYRPSISGRANTKFILYDLDMGRRRPHLDRYAQRKTPIFLYPHTARPQIIWDGIWEPHPGITCNFVIASGHEEVMRAYGYPYPIEVTGWAFCELLPFQPVKEIKNILFGPMHPSVWGQQPEIDIETNKTVYKKLLEYCGDTKTQLTVRHINRLALSGLWEAPGVKYIRARPDLSVREIDAADLVIGHQTFAYLALARGKPVLMAGENIPPHSITRNNATLYVKSWEKYAELMAYPLDALTGDIGELVETARKRNAKVSAWRKKFIGEPFDPGEFVRKLESYL